MLNLFVLMYADDTVIMAENEHDMQRNLNLLNDYCNCNKLKVNISKTKIKTRLSDIPTFKFFIFGVSKYSHNMPVYGELGRYPLSIKIKQRMVRYWSRILKSSEYKLTKVMYIIYNLHCKNVHLSPWIIYVSSIFQNCGSNYV